MDQAGVVRPRTWLQPWSPLNVVLLVTLAALAWRTGWGTVRLPAVIRGLGWALASAAAGWMLWAAATLGRNLTYRVETWREQTLVTAGPYRYVRHPIYLGLIALWIGAGLALGSWVMVLVGLLVVAPAEVARARLEDVLLARRFGEAFEDYGRRVPAIVPRIGNAGRGEPVERQ